MPIEIVNNCLKNEGWKTPLGKKIQKRSKKRLTHRQICEAIASIVEAKIKRRRQMKGGTNRPPTKTQTYIFSKDKFTKEQAINWLKEHGKKYSDFRETESSYRFTQIDDSKFIKNSYRTLKIDDGISIVIGHLKGTVVGGMTPPEFKVQPREDGYTWIRVADPETRLNAIDGKQYRVSEDAHIANLSAWTSKLYDIEGNIDHRNDKKIDIDIKEARYEFGDGLYLLTRTPDPEINERIRNGTLLPSIEGFVPDDNDVVDDEIEFYIPTGIAFMYEGKAMGKSVGPDIPSPTAIPVQGGVGGDNIGDDKKGNDKKEGGDVKYDNTTKDASDHKDVKNTGTNMKDDSSDKSPKKSDKSPDDKDLDKKKEEDWKKKYEEIEAKFKELLEAADKQKAAEKELREIYLSKLPEGLEIDKDAPLEEIKKLASIAELYEKKLREVTTEVKEKFKEVETRFPSVDEKDKGIGNKEIDEYGAMTTEAWARYKAQSYIDQGMKVPEDIAQYLKK